MKEYTKDLNTVGEQVTGKNFIIDPLLPPGGLPGKLTGEKKPPQGSSAMLFGFYVWRPTLAISALEVEAGGSESQGSPIHG